VQETERQGGTMAGLQCTCGSLPAKLASGHMGTPVSSGRMSLLDLQAALNVDGVYVDEKVAALVKRNPARYILLQGELMTACVAWKSKC